MLLPQAWAVGVRHPIGLAHLPFPGSRTGTAWDFGQGADNGQYGDRVIVFRLSVARVVLKVV
jgi:hypothetical protein